MNELRTQKRLTLLGLIAMGSSLVLGPVGFVGAGAIFAGQGYRLLDKNKREELKSERLERVLTREARAEEFYASFPGWHNGLKTEPNPNSFIDMEIEGAIEYVSSKIPEEVKETYRRIVVEKDMVHLYDLSKRGVREGYVKSKSGLRNLREYIRNASLPTSEGMLNRISIG